MTQVTDGAGRALEPDPSIDPFEVLDVPPLGRSLPRFLLMLPVTAAGFAGAFGLAPFLLPFFKGFSLPTKDRAARAVLFFLMMAAKFRITVVDRNASRADHAQLYVAPHVCMLEPVALMSVLGYIRPVAASMSKDLPLFGRFIDATDPIYVERDKAKKKAGPSVIEQLRESIEQTECRHLMFPEGTYTNGRSLLEFKVGAFVVGKPITPVLFHFHDYTPFWNREESTFGTQLYRIAACVRTRVTVEFLETYHPSEDEVADPALYARNVRALLARASGRALSTRSLQDSPNFRADVPG